MTLRWPDSNPVVKTIYLVFKNVYIFNYEVLHTSKIHIQEKLKKNIFIVISKLIHSQTFVIFFDVSYPINIM